MGGAHRQYVTNPATDLTHPWGSLGKNCRLILRGSFLLSRRGAPTVSIDIADEIWRKPDKKEKRRRAS